MTKPRKAKRSPLYSRTLEATMGAVDDGIKKNFGLREFVVKESDVRMKDGPKGLEFIVTLRIGPNPIFQNSLLGGEKKSP